MKNENKNIYRNIIITSIITAILITSGIGVAYADGVFPGKNIFGNTSGIGINIASGTNSAAFGAFTTANDTNSVAFGFNNTASGINSAVFGLNNIASAQSSAAFGIDNHASGIHSVAFGQETEARGEHSASFGKSTLAEANHSVAFGGATIASGEESAAFGRFTNSSTNLSFVIGRNNEVPAGGNVFLWVATDPLFVIGNGNVTGTGETQTRGTPHNAVTVLKNGNVGIGVSNPDTILHIQGLGSTDAELFLEPGEWNSSGDYGQIKFGDANHYIRGEYDSGMTFYDVNGFSFAGGNVGIGTTNPTSKLEIVDNDVNFQIIPGHKGNTANSGYTTLEMPGVQTLFIWDNLEVDSNIVANSYIQLDTNSGTPPSADCDASDEIGRMKVDSTSRQLYVCTYDGSTYAWLTLQ